MPVSEKEKMLAGELYDATDNQLQMERLLARQLVKEYNATAPDRMNDREIILEKLFGKTINAVQIEPPFYCDYGSNISIGDRVFFNFNCVILDVSPVFIGNDTLFGPNVQIYAATHPLDWKVRASGLESGKPVHIGSNVWIGGSAVICPGVIIGDRSIIGAGSVVTRDIPPDVFAAGNPCRVIRSLNKEGNSS